MVLRRAGTGDGRRHVDPAGRRGGVVVAVAEDSVPEIGLGAALHGHADGRGNALRLSRCDGGRWRDGDGEGGLGLGHACVGLHVCDWSVGCGLASWYL